MNIVRKDFAIKNHETLLSCCLFGVEKGFPNCIGVLVNKNAKVSNILVASQ